MSANDRRTFVSPSENEMPGNPLEEITGGVPDHVGVPKTDRKKKPFRKGVASGQLLAAGLSTEPKVNNQQTATFEQLLQTPVEASAAAQPKVETVTSTKSEKKVMSSAAASTVTKRSVKSRSSGPTAKRARPIGASRARKNAVKKTAKKAEQQSWWQQLFAGVNDGYNSTMDKAHAKFEETRKGAMSRLEKIQQRAISYRNAISESDWAKDVATYGTETAIAVADGLAKAGMWTVEVLASGWILVTDGGWKLTLAVCDGVVWVYSYAAAATVEAYESGVELLNSVLGWCEEHEVEHKDARRKSSKIKLAAIA